MAPASLFDGTVAPVVAAKEKGGRLHANRPYQHQEINMLKVADRLADDKGSIVSLDFIYEGSARLSALEMNRILRECAYEHQRNISERHVLVLADLMRRDKWQPKSQIDIAVLDGRYVLVNGYHRGYAQVRSGKTIEWNIALHRVKAEADLRVLYHAFDTNIRIRKGRDILRAAEFSELTGVPPEVAASLYNAVPFIASKFFMAKGSRNVLVDKQADRRLDFAREYAKAAQRFAAACEGMPQHRRLKLKGGAVMAVGVITFRYQSDAAWQFWSGVAQMDALKRGDPRLALCNDFMMRKVAGGGNVAASYAPAMIAWNAFFNERPLQLIKVLDGFVPVIDGTPFDGKPPKEA